MIKTKVAFLEGQIFSSQLELLDTFSIALTGWIKAGPLKKPLCFDHVNRLLIKKFFSRNIGKICLKMYNFFFKKAVKSPQRPGAPPLNPRQPPAAEDSAPDPCVVTSTY